LTDHAAQNGVGHTYLIQHSARKIGICLLQTWINYC